MNPSSDKVYTRFHRKTWNLSVRKNLRKSAGEKQNAKDKPAFKLILDCSFPDIY